MNPETILHNPFLNKGTAFTDGERRQYGLDGLLPPFVRTLEQQEISVYKQFLTKEDAVQKRLFLMEIFNTNHVLFYKLFSQHIEEMMPIVYDPTIADTIEHYSDLFIETQNATYLSIENPDQISQALKNSAAGRDIRLIVVTDAEAILGIGDWGTQGVDIAVGKLMVYTAAAGINPRQVLPVVLDVGTYNPKLLADQNYLGNRTKRVTGQRYDDFVDQFVTAATTLFPQLYLHFEDFGRDNASKILNKYKNKITTFNDDIQGTGIITLAGLLGAMTITNQKLTDQIYLSFGAGTAGAGITQRIYAEFLNEGLSPQEAKRHFYLVDKQGLLFTDTPGLTPEQQPFARDRAEFSHPNELTNLAAVVQAIHPTILVGTSTVAGAFSERIIKNMAQYTERPIIFPLSNPTKLAEATAKDLLTWTNGRALVATGVPASPVTLNGVTYQIGQANNALVYPGLGLGTIASTSRLLTDSMISAAAHSLGGLVKNSQPGAAVLPPVKQLNQFSQTVAIAVAQQAVDEQLNQEPITDVKAAVKAATWTPEYRPLSL